MPSNSPGLPLAWFLALSIAQPCSAGNPGKEANWGKALGLQFQPATWVSIQKECGTYEENAAMCNFLAASEEPFGQVKLMMLFGTTKPYNPTDEGKFTAFPTHCLAKYFAAKGNVFDAGYTGEYACGCKACTAAEKAANTAADKAYKVGLNALADTTKNDYYVECEDYDHWEAVMDNMMERQHEFWDEYIPVMCKAFLANPEGTAVGRRLLSTPSTSAFASLAECGTSCASSDAQSCLEDCVRPVRRRLALFQPQRDTSNGWCLDDCRQWFNCVYDYVGWEDVGTAYVDLGDRKHLLMPELDSDAFQKNVNLVATQSLCDEPSNFRRSTYILTFLELLAVIAIGLFVLCRKSEKWAQRANKFIDPRWQFEPGKPLSPLPLGLIVAAIVVLHVLCILPGTFFLWCFYIYLCILSLITFCVLFVRTESGSTSARKMAEKFPLAATLGLVPGEDGGPEFNSWVEQMFTTLDVDRSGTISRQEGLAMIGHIKLQGVTAEYITEIWDIHDKNSDGVLDKREFADLMRVLARHTQDTPIERQRRLDALKGRGREQEYMSNPGAASQGKGKGKGAPAPPQASPWSQMWSDEHNRPYWHNAATGETTWEQPR